MILDRNSSALPLQLDLDNFNGGLLHFFRAAYALTVTAIGKSTSTGEALTSGK